MGEDKMINFLVWIIVGALVGWLASLIMSTRGGLLVNMVVGIVGAFLGGWLLSPLLGTGTINQGDFSLGGLLTSLLGAIILLALVRLIRGSATTV
jgi:uncharacterized membrane protein YeaQ/YmgE (transglycosylase-associated protein family)